MTSSGHAASRPIGYGVCRPSSSCLLPSCVCASSFHLWRFHRPPPSPGERGLSTAASSRDGSPVEPRVRLLQMTQHRRHWQRHRRQRNPRWSSQCWPGAWAAPADIVTPLPPRPMHLAARGGRQLCWRWWWHRGCQRLFFVVQLSHARAKRPQRCLRQRPHPRPQHRLQRPLSHHRPPLLAPVCAAQGTATGVLRRRWRCHRGSRATWKPCGQVDTPWSPFYVGLQ